MLASNKLVDIDLGFLLGDDRPLFASANWGDHFLNKIIFLS